MSWRPPCSGLIVPCALWWAYFDVVAVVAERRFRHMPAELRVRIARDSYSYLHLPMIAGIVLVALGVKKTVEHVDEPLEPTCPAVGAVRRDRALLRRARRPSGCATSERSTASAH